MSGKLLWVILTFLGCIEFLLLFPRLIWALKFYEVSCWEDVLIIKIVVCSSVMIKGCYSVCAIVVSWSSFQHLFIVNPSKQFPIEIRTGSETQKNLQAFSQLRAIFASKSQLWQALETTNCLFQDSLPLCLVAIVTLLLLLSFLHYRMGLMILKK